MKPTTTQHTPTPWEYRTRRLGDERNPPHYEIRPAGSEGWALAKVTLCVPHPICDGLTRFNATEGEANAAFIVEACNSHAQNLATIAAQQKRIEELEGALERIASDAPDKEPAQTDDCDTIAASNWTHWHLAKIARAALTPVSRANGAQEPTP